MAENQEKQPDESDASHDAWLNGLRGLADPAADPISSREAQALRRGLQARRDRLETLIPKADDMLFDQIRFRIRRERAATTRLWGKPEVWGLAASLVVGLALVIQMAGPGHEGDPVRAINPDIMRGAPASATVQLVDDPLMRRDELVTLLKRAGAEPTVKVVRETGEVFIEVAATQAVQDALASDEVRIFPNIRDGWITLVLKPTKAKP